MLCAYVLCTHTHDAYDALSPDFVGIWGFQSISSGGYKHWSYLSGLETTTRVCVLLFLYLSFERERDCSVFRQAVRYLTGYPPQKGFFPYKGGQCFSRESWPRYKVDEVTFIFKATETALQGKKINKKSYVSWLRITTRKMGGDISQIWSSVTDDVARMNSKGRKSKCVSTSNILVC